MCKQEFVRFGAAIAVAQLASLGSYALYLPSPAVLSLGVAAVVALTILALVGLRHGVVRPAWVLVAATVVTSVVALFVYPRADALRVKGLGTDQDDAVIAVAMGLWRGEYPFATPTYLGNPVSPGSLWALMHLPFAATGTYILVPVGALVTCVALVRKYGGTHAAAAMLIAVGTAPVFWEALATGSDQFTVGCLTIVLVILLHDSAGGRKAWGAAILGTVLATARLVYPYLPALAGLVAARSVRAWCAAHVATAAGVVLHLSFYFWRPEGYGPLNVLHRADASLAGWWRYAAAVSMIAVIWAALRRGRKDLGDHLYWVGWCLAVPLGWMVVGRAAEQGLWLASYLVPALLPLAAGAALTTEEHR